MFPIEKLILRIENIQLAFGNVLIFQESKNRAGVPFHKAYCIQTASNIYLSEKKIISAIVLRRFNARLSASTVLEHYSLIDSFVL